jgi:hypothetical protein
MVIRSARYLLLSHLGCLSIAIACNRQGDEQARRSASTKVRAAASDSGSATTGSAASATRQPQIPDEATTRGPAPTEAATATDPDREDPASPARWSETTIASRPLPTEAPRLYAKTRHVWIYPELDATKQWIGYLWSGTSVALRDPKPKYGIGCGEFFYAIVPRGYVCTDGGRATTDPKDPVVLALSPYAPRADSPWPHRYGESRGAPLYSILPSELEQRMREPDLASQLKRLARARDIGHGEGSLLGVDLAQAPEQNLVFPRLSPAVYDAHPLLKNRSTVAYTKELRYAGRDFLLTADYRFIPKDRVVPYPVSRFHGVHLGVDGTWPLAFFREDHLACYRRTAPNAFEAQPNCFARLSHVELSGKSEQVNQVEYLETKAGTWLDRADAVVPTLAERTPWDARVGQPDESPMRPKGRATWIEVSIRGGWLIAYEDTTPAFVTLISPGRGGEPLRGHIPLETASTPLGRFSITGKFVTSTMVAPNDYLHSDVPFAQNFTGPYALHSAYWHDNWGNLMSGGCINLSPIDALFMFHWTEPPAPEGWHGTRWLPYLEPSTTLIINR